MTSDHSLQTKQTPTASGLQSNPKENEENTVFVGLSWVDARTGKEYTKVKTSKGGYRIVEVARYPKTAVAQEGARRAEYPETWLPTGKEKTEVLPDQSTSLGHKATDGTSVLISPPARTVGAKTSATPISAGKTMPDQSVPLGKRATEGTSVYIKAKAKNGESRLSTSMDLIPDQAARLDEKAMRGTSVDISAPANPVRTKEEQQVPDLPDQATPQRNPAKEPMSNKTSMQERQAILQPDQAARLDKKAMLGTLVDILAPSRPSQWRNGARVPNSRIAPPKGQTTESPSKHLGTMRVPDQTTRLDKKAMLGTSVDIAAPMRPVEWTEMSPEQAAPLRQRPAAGASVWIASPTAPTGTMPAPDQTARLDEKAMQGTSVDISAPKRHFASNNPGAMPVPNQTARLDKKAMLGTSVDISAPSQPVQWKKSTQVPNSPDQAARLDKKAMLGTSVDISAPRQPMQWEKSAQAPNSPDQAVPLGQRATAGTSARVAAPASPRNKSVSIETEAGGSEPMRVPDQAAPLEKKVIQGTSVDSSPPPKAPTNDSVLKETGAESLGAMPPPDQAARLDEKAMLGTSVDILAPKRPLESTKEPRVPDSPDQAIPLGQRATAGTSVRVAPPTPQKSESAPKEAEADSLGAMRVPDQAARLDQKAMLGTSVDITAPRRPVEWRKEPPLGQRASTGTSGRIAPLVSETAARPQDPGAMRLPDQATRLGKKAMLGTSVETPFSRKPTTQANNMDGKSPQRKKKWKQVPAPGGFRLVAYYEDEGTDTRNVARTGFAGVRNAEMDERALRKKKEEEEAERRRQEWRRKKEEAGNRAKARRAVAKIREFFNQKFRQQQKDSSGRPEVDQSSQQWVDYDKTWGTIPSSDASATMTTTTGFESETERANYYFVKTVNTTATARLTPPPPNNNRTNTPFFASRMDSGTDDEAEDSQLE